MLSGFEELRDEFLAEGVSIIAASVDDAAQSGPVAEPLSFPVAIGVDRAVGDAIGAFWDERRDFIQPSEFLLRQDGRVVSSTYSAGPVGRTNPPDALSMVKFINGIARKKADG